MRSTILRATTIACVTVLSSLRASVSSDSEAVVSTFAGSGLAGNHDGSRMTATFSSPASITVAQDGDIYIVDRALNTLRRIHNSVVSTVVGDPDGDPIWRSGGYRDGPASLSLLNHPEAVAADADGSILIADTWNACVRRYKGGYVTTIVGSPTGSALKRPTSIAVDQGGDIYVGDLGGVIRKIDPHGNLSTLSLRTSGEIYGLATSAPDRLYVSDEAGLLVTSTDGKVPDMRLASYVSLRENDQAQARAPVGHPYALSPIDFESVAYTDMYDDSIHLVLGQAVRRIAGQPAADPNEAGGFRDGLSAQARFNAPFGLAMYQGGWLVADAGNHRIRFVSAVDLRDSVRQDHQDRIANFVTQKRPVIVLIGNSEVWTDSSYADSIAGQLQSREPNKDVVPITLPGLDNPSLIGNYIQNLLAVDPGYTVIYLFNSAGITNHYRTSYADLARGGSWLETLSHQFDSLEAEVKPAKLFVVDVPIGIEASPSEGAFAQRLYLSSSPEWSYITKMHTLVAALATSRRLPYVDLWQQFRDIDANGGGPLYHQFDTHISANGRAQLAAMLAQMLKSQLSR